MNKIPLLLFLLLLTVTADLYAQDLIIEKDMLTGTVTYKKIKKDSIATVRHIPLIKKNNKVIIKLVNLNPFAYTVNYQFAQQDVKQHFDSTKSLISYLSGNLGEFAAITKLMSPNDTGAIAGSRGGARTADGLREDAEAELAKMQTYYDLQLKHLRYFNIMAQYLYSRRDDQTVIETAIKQALADALNIGVDELNSAPDIIQKNFEDMSKAYSELKKNINAALARYTADQKDEVNSAKETLKKADLLYGLFTTPDVITRLEIMPSLPYLIHNASFTYLAEEIIKSDYADLTVNIVNKRRAIAGCNLPDLDSGLTVTIKERINAKGEFVIRSSVGFAFPTFFNQKATFGIDDNKVGQFDDNGLIPNLATFINFYPFKGKFENFGGVFGIGYPLSGKEKNMNLFLGISESLGDKNFVIFNAGVGFGQSQKLGNGWKTGDDVPTGVTEIPTDKTWKVGVFAGITLSLFNR